MSTENSIFKIDITARRVWCRDELVALGLVMDYYGNLYTVDDWADPATRIPLTEEELRVRRLERGYNNTAGGIHIDDETARETAAVIQEIRSEHDANAAAVFAAGAQLEKMAQEHKEELEEAKRQRAESDKRLEMALAELERVKAASADAKVKELEEALNDLRISKDQTINEQNRTVEQLRREAGSLRTLWHQAEERLENSGNLGNRIPHTSRRERRRRERAARASRGPNRTAPATEIEDETL